MLKGDIFSVEVGDIQVLKGERFSVEGREIQC